MREGSFKELPLQTKKLVSSKVESLSLELKSLPENLKYVFLGPNKIFSVVILSHLKENQEEHLFFMICTHKEALRWNMVDIKGMDPFICIHRIALEGDAKLITQMQNELYNERGGQSRSVKAPRCRHYLFICI